MDIFAPLKQTCLILIFLIQLIAVKAQVKDSVTAITNIAADSGKIKKPLVDTVVKRKTLLLLLKSRMLFQISLIKVITWPKTVFSMFMVKLNIKLKSSGYRKEKIGCFTL